MLSKILSGENWNVNIITNKGDLINFIKTENINFVIEQICFQSYNPIKIIKSLHLLNKIVKKYNIQILHSHHRYYEVLGYLLKKVYNLQNLGLVTTVHSMHRKRIFAIKYPSEKIITVSNYLKDYLIKNYKIRDDKIEAIYNFVNTVDSNIPTSKNKKLTILSVGRLSYEKGYDIVIRALTEFSNTDYQYYLVGEGREINNLKNLAKKCKVNIKFIPSEFDLSTYYSICDICIIPSRNEGLSYVAMEAGLYSIPVVASNTGGLKEIIVNEETGLLFETDNYKHLLKTINRLKGNRELAQKLGNKLNQKVLTEFNVEIYKQKMLKLYNSL
jgi:glycosyltransferase involved in cell wall biosynthesis